MTANISPHMPFRIGNIASGAREARHRIDLLDMIKAAAILMVIFCHLPIPYIRRIILFPLIVDQAVPVFIMLMGYCHAMSLDNQRTTAGKRFKHKLAKLCRFAVPWLMIILIEIVILLAGRQIPGSWPQLAEHFGKFSFGGLFLMGGYGAGGYFFYVMIQLYILIPLLDRFKGWRLLAIGFAINILFEIAVRVFDIPMHIYRITALRYVFLAASGIFLYRLRRTTWRGKLKTPLISLCIISGCVEASHR